MNKLIEGLENRQNKLASTLNGARSYKSTKSALLDFFSKSGALRNNTEKDVISLFSKAYSEDKLLALKSLFYTRDIRGGQGERRTFRTLLKWLTQNDKVNARLNLHLVPLYGRWDDLLVLFGTELEQDAVKLFADQLREDLDQKDDTNLSLCAKWTPSINTSSMESRKQAAVIASYMGLSHREYRKMLSNLRARLNVVERLMCANEWDKIEYSHVPSRASLTLRKAFDKHDHARYVAWKDKVTKGQAKVNASALFPYDIVREVAGRNVDPQALDNQWRALPNYLSEDSSGGLVVCDVSGSMGTFHYYNNSNKNVQPIHVSVSLAIYFAERNNGPFKDRFITFSESPTLQRVQGHNISEKVLNLSQASWDMNTNLQAVFDLVLNTAVKNNVPQNEMPDTLYIISDMQFDQACRSNKKTNFEVIQKKYEKAGYQMPVLVFWNVNAHSDTPVTVDHTGTLLVSGCSPSILKTILTRKSVSAYDLFVETVSSERYKFVSAA